MDDRRYLIQIVGEPESLKRLTEQFRGPDFDVIAASTGEVHLSGSIFEDCADPDEVITAASHILRRIASILQIYEGTPHDFEIRSVIWKHDSGRWKRRMLETVRLRVTSSAGLEELATSTTNDTTLGSDLLRLASIDDDVARAFDLIRAKNIGWYEIYDLIDVMGTIDGMVKEGLATRGLLSSIRQTANHYRHLGSTAEKKKLPSNSPSLNMARATITQLFRQWLRARLAQVTNNLTEMHQ